jgi:two-component system C4-dicarboxylate transport response regulator DctD
MPHYSWPGNVRELKNAAERMLSTACEGVAGPFTPDEGLMSARLLSLPAAPGRLRDELERTEWTAIDAALREHHGEIGVTAQHLGISRRALYERMAKYGLDKKPYRA